jgi:hypothetical protein
VQGFSRRWRGGYALAKRLVVAEENRKRWEAWKAAGIDPTHGGGGSTEAGGDDRTEQPAQAEARRSEELKYRCKTSRCEEESS